ncbi:MAG TPA: UbiX family flavin prenyltransferase [Ktedonobacteraceae bacterium]|jgi:flavin prenyltransferase|nr:UbiX family flavin prenyltransferase [Ktedonobacteraceae bacterium]
MRIIIGISGSTGAIYGVRLLEVLHSLPDMEVHLVMSEGAKTTITYETEYHLEDVCKWAHTVHDPRNVGASIASGTFITGGMIVAPCSMKTLSSIANSYNDNLMTRAADVCLKERRRLVLLVRETPLHLGHLRLMTQVTEAGGIILPPVPGFYQKPTTMLDLVDHSLGKALDLFGIEHHLYTRWNGLTESPSPSVNL